MNYVSREVSEERDYSLDSYTLTESKSRSVVSNSLRPYGLYSPWNSPGQKTGVSSRSLLQGIFPTQGSNPGLPHCRWILEQLSHKGCSRRLQWVAYPFSSSSSWTRNWTWVSCIGGGFFTSWATREAHTLTLVKVLFFGLKSGFSWFMETKNH